MAVYLKKNDDGTVTAMGNLAAVEKFGGKWDKKISDSAWTGDWHCSAKVDSKGKIVSGMDDEALEELHAKRIRAERNRLLAQNCDSISALRLSAMTSSQRNKLAQYRQALLDVPQQSGFPWDGDVSKAPWPTKPE